MKKFLIVTATLAGLVRRLELESSLGWDVVSIAQTDAEKNLFTIVLSRDLQLHQEIEEAARQEDWEALRQLLQR